MGNSPDVSGPAPVHTFTSSDSWIEGDALRQLHDVAKTPGMRAVAGLPDLHPGKYGPVGCALLADAVHPAFVGADIGCGMGLFGLDIQARKIRLDKAAERMAEACDGAWGGDIDLALADAGLDRSAFDASLGTVGGGNHFCELQAIHEIVDADAAAASLDRKAAYLLVHSGSRGLGYSVLERILADGLVALDPSSVAGRAYLADHDVAVRWAAANRATIARRAAEALYADHRRIADLSHNFAEVRTDGVLHRKGAAPADRGLVPIPGSRGTLSYLVRPLPHAPREALASLAHGAGRKYDRASMLGRAGRTKSERDALARNPFGGIVVCEDRDLMVEEAPIAYKSIDQVISDLVAHGLVSVVATFKPLVTFKKAGGAGVHAAAANRERKRDRDTDRRRNRQRGEDNR
jgi:release factor H-coupled RctB family protein